jgi:hypothetical protein
MYHMVQQVLEITSSSQMCFTPEHIQQLFDVLV